MAANDFFLQRLADLLGIAVVRPALTETTAFGAACLAGLGVGLYASLDEIAALWKADRSFEPVLDASARDRDLAGWRQAVSRVLS
jgi:glycerol kinase